MAITTETGATQAPAVNYAVVRLRRAAIVVHHLDVDFDLFVPGTPNIH